MIKRLLKTHFLFLAISLAFLAFCLAVPKQAMAVKLYLEPADGEYRPGDTFLVGIRIDTEGDCINVAEAHLMFQQDMLEAVDFSQGESILSLWIQPPAIEQAAGKISFIGGMPGEYCGRLSGDPGESNLLGKVIFRVSEAVKQAAEGLAEVSFSDASQVLLSDMAGTKAQLSTEGAVFRILPERIDGSQNEWQKELEKDTLPPESFDVGLGQHPSVFEGKYFISFFTTDKQTGIEYFEVKEGKRDWEKAESPYLLKDQNIKGIIMVKAVDKAGNERIVEVQLLFSSKKYLVDVLVLVILGLLITGTAVWIIVVRRKSRVKRFQS